MFNKKQSFGPPEMDFSDFSPLEIKIRNGQFDRALKIFRSMVQADGILALYKSKQAYEKPSVKKRRKKNEALQRIFEAEMKQKKIESGEFERERLKKEMKKEKRRLEKMNESDQEQSE